MLSSHPIVVPTNFDGGMLDIAATRTPAKPIHKTPGRTMLRSRAALQENAAYYGGITTTTKKKGKALMQTPFRPVLSPQKGLRTAVKPSIVLSRPLGDKTPFPNRQQNVPPLHTPAPQTAKVAKLALFDQEFVLTPGHLLLPSSTRKSLRAPRPSGSGRKHFEFKTPATNGNHWDVSDGDMDLVTNAAETQPQEGVKEDVEDYDEIEYMPPKVPEQPYEPLFPMPDYKVLGRNLLALAHSNYVDDAAELYFARSVEAEFDCDRLLEETCAFRWEQPSLPELREEDPFRQPALGITHKPGAKPLARAKSTTTASTLAKAPASRIAPSTQVATARTTTSTRPASTTSSRPSSSTSTRPNSANATRVAARVPNIPASESFTTKPPSSTTNARTLDTKVTQTTFSRGTHLRAISAIPSTSRPVAPSTVIRSRSVTVPKSNANGSHVASTKKAGASLFDLPDDRLLLNEDFMFQL